MKSAAQASLPAASPSTVLEVFQRVYSASPTDAFKRGDLQQLGISQCRQAVTLVRFLRLVDDAGVLRDDVFQAKRSPAQFCNLLRSRLEAALRDAGLWSDEVAALGAQEIAPRQLKSVLSGLAAVRRQKSLAAKTNIRGCLRTLHEFLLAGCDPQWIKRQYEARRANRERFAARAAGRRIVPPRRSPSTALPHEPLRPSQPAAAPSGRKLKPPEGTLVQAEQIHVGYTDDGDDILVEAWFNPPLSTLTRQQLLTLVKNVQKRAPSAAPQIDPAGRVPPARSAQRC